MVHVCQQKQILPWLQNEFLFQASSYKKPYDKALHALHKFTRTVIYQRRKILRLENESFISSEKEILNDLIIDQNSESPTTPKLGLKYFL